MGGATDRRQRRCAADADARWWQRCAQHGGEGDAPHVSGQAPHDPARARIGAPTRRRHRAAPVARETEGALRPRAGGGHPRRGVSAAQPQPLLVDQTVVHGHRVRADAHRLVGSLARRTAGCSRCLPCADDQRFGTPLAGRCATRRNGHRSVGVRARSGQGRCGPPGLPRSAWAERRTHRVGGIGG